MSPTSCPSTARRRGVRSLAVVLATCLVVLLAPAASALPGITGIPGIPDDKPAGLGDQQPNTTRDRPGWGRTAAQDKRLRSGCHHYAYRYRVTPPTEDWLAEIVIRRPDRTNIAFRTVDSDQQPARDTVTFRSCRASLQPGRYRIKMKVSAYYDDEPYGGRVRDSYFRMRARR